MTTAHEYRPGAALASTAHAITRMTDDDDYAILMVVSVLLRDHPEWLVAETRGVLATASAKLLDWAERTAALALLIPSHYDDIKRNPVAGTTNLRGELERMLAARRQEGDE